MNIDLNIVYYKYLLYKVEKLNKKNVRGYDTFKEYVLSDEKMLKYYKRLKSLEKRIKNLRVDSYETFEKTVFTQLDDIFNKMLSKILEQNNSQIKVEKLRILKKDLENCLGYSFDEKIEKLLNKIDKIIIEPELYKKNDVKSSNKYEEPLFDEIVDFVISQGKASASLLQRRFRFGYNRAAMCVDLLEDRGIVGPQIGSRPREVLVQNRDDIKYEDVIIKNTNEETSDKIIKAHTEEEIIDMLKNEYNILTEYDKIDIFSKLENTLYTNSNNENEKSDLVDKIIKYSRPSDVKLVLLDIERYNFNHYSGLPNLLTPAIYDIKRIKVCMNRLVDEMNNRLDNFVNYRVKNFEEYKNKKDSKLSSIIVIISEIYELLKEKEIYDAYLKLLLNGERTGIKIISFSKLSKKNLELKSFTDLIKIYNKYELSLSNSNKSNDKENNIDEMSGLDFEEYSAKILESNGFNNVEVTKSSGDFGVDVIAYKDDIKYAIQCKKYSAPVGIKAVQEVIGSKTMNNCHVAVVLTNNYFTKSAKELAEKNNVLLWDRDKLSEMETFKKDSL